MLALYGAGFWLFYQNGLRQTPRVENTLKVPRFLCAYFPLFLFKAHGVTQKPQSE